MSDAIFKIKDTGFVNLSIEQEDGQIFKREKVDIFDLYNRLSEAGGNDGGWAEINTARRDVMVTLGYPVLSTAAVTRICEWLWDYVATAKKNDASNKSAETPGSTGSPSGLPPVSTTLPVT